MTDCLLSRLNEAAGPDRELDGLIALDNGWKQLAHDLWRKGDDVAEAPPRYTGDTDTARTLLPAGASWSIYSLFSKYGAQISTARNAVTEIGPNPALALLIAIYSAREAGKESA